MNILNVTHIYCKILLIEINKREADFAKQEIQKYCLKAEFLDINLKSELLRALSTFKPAVVVIDPAIDGFSDLLNDVNYFNDVNIPVIVYTSSSNEATAFEFMNNGAWDYIPKEDHRRLGLSVKNAAEFSATKKEISFTRRDIDEFEAYVKKFRDWEAHIPAVVYSFILKPDGTQNFTYLSTASKQFLGYTPEEIVKDSSIIDKLVHPEDLPIVTNAIIKSAQNLTSFEKEIRLIIKGKTRWFSFFSNPERKNDSVLWSGIIVDVTEKKKIEEALSAEHYFMRVLMDNSPDAIYFKDLESRFLTVNKAYLNKIGIQSDKELAGKTDFDIYDHVHAQNARNDELEIIRTGKPIVDILEKEVFGDGKIAWVSTTKVPLRNKDGVITGTFGISRDVTERKNTEEALDSERSLMRVLIDALPDLIYVKDVEEKFLLDNKAHLEFVNVTAFEQIAGKSNFEILEHDAAEKFHWEDEEVLSGNSIYNHETKISGPDGNSRYLLSTKLPLRNTDGKIIGLVGITHDATENRLIQEQLRLSEEKMRYIVNSTSSVLFNISVAGGVPNFIWVGDNVKYLLGYSPEEVMHPEWWKETVHPDDLDFIAKSFPSLFKSKRLNLEFRLKHAEKHYVWVNTELNYSDNPDEAQFGIFGSWIDITERMMAQEALLKSEEQLSYALKIARLAYWEYDTNEDIFIFNDQVYDVLGSSAKEADGYTMSSADFINKFIHPGDINEISEALHNAAGKSINESNNQLEFRNIGSDGSTHYYLLFIYTSPAYTGNSTKAYGIIQDITAGKVHMAALKESEKKLSNAVKIAHLAYWEYDVVYDLFTFNDQFYSLFKTDAVSEGGYTMSARHYAERFVHPDDRYLIGAEVQKSNETDDPAFSSYIEHRILYANGETGYIAVRFFIVKDQNGKTIKSFGANQEITERVEREKEKRELEKELLIRNKELESMLDDMTRMQKTLVQTEKMASLGALSAGIAHEINNPLSYVCSNVNRLKEYFDDTVCLLQKWNDLKPQLNAVEQVSEQLIEIEDYSGKIDMDFILQDFDRMMSSIQDGTQRIKKIVEGMRGFSHISGNSMANADINKAIDETLTIVWNEIKYKAVIEKEYQNLPPVKCNIGEIKQVLVNLLVNASHAIEEKGIIKISTLLEDDILIIKVSDNGSGITEDKLKRIFDPFFTTKPVGKGTGLGLWISSTIVEKHGGSLTVDSVPGSGSTFTIMLPFKSDN
jgi:two-component system, NtrC family, sensor kinase